MDMRKKEGRKVERIREEIKYIRRYISLHNKKKSTQEILSFIKSLQRAIVQKLIRKTSPMATEIEAIQSHLIKIYNSMRGDRVISIPDKELTRMVSLAGGEKVYTSVSLIKRFIGLQGKHQEREKIDSFIAEMEAAVKNGKVTKDDPFIKEINHIYRKLKVRAGNTIWVSTQELHGLEGIANACTCKKDLGQIHRIKKSKAVKMKGLRPCRKKTYTDSENQGACSHNGGLSGVLTAEQMATRQLDLLEFFSFWLTLFGKPAKNFTMMFHGEPHNGKTILLLKIAQYLAEFFGNVLYISSEEFASPTMTTKVQEFLNPFPERLHFAENLKDPNLSKYEFIILDSVNDLGLKVSDYKDLRKANPDTAFIFILQHTKSGDFKGGKDWEHITEIAGEVEKGVVTITKNRYAPKTSLDFFRQFGLQWKDAEPPSHEPSSVPAATPQPYPVMEQSADSPADSGY